MDCSYTPPVSQLAMDAYREAAPYLSNLSWLRDLLTAFIKEAKSLDDLERLLEGEMGRVGERTEETDIHIYLTHLRRVRKGM